MLGLERRRELGERDIRHRVDDLDQEVHIRRKLAPRPGGRPIRRGSSVPRSAIRFAIRTAVLGLTPKCRAAARREPPRTMKPEIRSRRSREYARPMIHLR